MLYLGNKSHLCHITAIKETHVLHKDQTTNLLNSFSSAAMKPYNI